MEPLVAGGLVALGGVTGLLSGLFGVGGGFLLVPMLALAGRPMLEAVGTSLVYVAAIGVGGAVTHWRAANVDRRFVALTAVPAAAVAPLGAVGAAALPDWALTVGFAAFLGLVAARTGLKPDGPEAAGPPPGALPSVALGLAVGVLSGLFGVGGGLIFVPAQVALFRIPIKRAVGNSLAAVLLTGVVGVAAHLAIGRVDLPAAGLLIAGGLVGLAGGTRLLKRISAARLRTALVAFLYGVAALMAAKGLTAG